MENNAFFVWLDGAMLVQHASVSTLPQIDQLQTVFIILTMQAASKHVAGVCAGPMRFAPGVSQQ